MKLIDGAPGLSAAFIAIMLAGCTSVDQHAPPLAPTAEQGALVEPDLVPAVYKIGPADKWIGAVTTYYVRDKDTLLDIARDYDLGYTQLIAANRGIDPWAPPSGTAITLPARYLLPDGPRKGIVINLTQQRLFYFRDDHTVETYPIGVGVDGFSTPLGLTRVTKKQIHPVWYVPASIRAEDPDLPAVVTPGLDNPLGDYAMQMGGTSFLIHGTNKPYGVGRNVSHGCVHLYPEDIERLYPRIKIGTPVRIVEQEVAAAWIGKGLYVAVFPNKAQTEALEIGMPIKEKPPRSLTEQVLRAAAGHAAQIDWAAVDQAGRERSGLPVEIGRPASGMSSAQ